MPERISTGAQLAIRQIIICEICVSRFAFQGSLHKDLHELGQFPQDLLSLDLWSLKSDDEEAALLALTLPKFAPLKFALLRIVSTNCASSRLASCRLAFSILAFEGLFWNNVRMLVGGFILGSPMCALFSLNSIQH